MADQRRDRQRVGQRQTVQGDQRIDRGLVAVPDRLGRIAFDHALVAEVLENEKSRLEIGGIDLGRREPALSQAVGERDERLHVLGQMGDRPGRPGCAPAAVGSARRVHQEDVALPSVSRQERRVPPPIRLRRSRSPTRR
jgi:hypothetical protein